MNENNQRNNDNRENNENGMMSKIGQTIENAVDTLTGENDKQKKQRNNNN